MSRLVSHNVCDVVKEHRKTQQNSIALVGLVRKKGELREFLLLQLRCISRSLQLFRSTKSRVRRTEAE